MSLSGEYQRRMMKAVGEVRRLRSRVGKQEAALRTAEATMSIIPPRTMTKRYLETLDMIRATLAKDPTQ